MSKEKKTQTTKNNNPEASVQMVVFKDIITRLLKQREEPMTFIEIINVLGIEYDPFDIEKPMSDKVKFALSALDTLHQKGVVMSSFHKNDKGNNEYYFYHVDLEQEFVNKHKIVLLENKVTIKNYGQNK